MSAQETAEDRWARLVAVACPECGLQVFVINVPSPTPLWCGSCPSTPRLETSAT
jgi:hypothetical protein